MKNGIWLVVLLGFSASAWGQLVESLSASAQTAEPLSSSAQSTDVAGDVATITTCSERQRVLAAVLRMSDRLHGSDATTVFSAQTSIQRELAVSRSTSAIRQLARIAHGRANTALVTTVLQRLQFEKNDEFKAALCNALEFLIEATPLPTTTQDQVLAQTGSILTNSTAPTDLVSAAAMASAQLGGPGFDQLMKAREGKAQRKLKDIFYLAVARTLDDRAIAVLREAAADPTQTEGKRIQAISSLGQLFAGRADAGRPVSPEETSATVALLKHLIAGAQSDQFFSIALRVTSQIAGPTETPLIRAYMLDALRSGRPERQWAAVSSVYARADLRDSEVLGLITPLASTTGNDVLRAEAEAVLDAVQTVAE